MRTLTGRVGWAVAAWAAATALLQLYFAGFGFPEPRVQRSLHLMLLVPLAFMLHPARRDGAPAPTWIDWAWSLGALVANGYSLLHADRINMRIENVDPLLVPDLLMGIVCSVTLVEALRRAVTPVLAALVGTGVAYLFVCEHLPSLLHYRDMPLTEIVETLYLLNGTGIYGAITGIAATTVATFIVFGAFVEQSGIAHLFHQIGMRVAGRQSGGPAKVEVFSSALFGTVSGSSTANVYTTGCFTIPAMVKLGYPRPFAAGVEAASSVGGQIMPPIMGAGAFVMAEITNTPYATIAIAAIVGALCYFLMILFSVHFQAQRLRLSGCDPSEIPAWRAVFADVHLLIPVVLLIGLLVEGFSPHFAAFWSVLSVVPCSWLRRRTRLGPRIVGRMLVSAGRNMVMIALACAGAGMFMACLTVTGVIVAVSSSIAGASGGSLVVAGLILMGVTLLLGTGLPTTAAYIIGASIGAKALIDLGAPVLAAHLFVFYFAVLADATPPVSVASYAAASIARCNPMAAGLWAFRLASAGFIVGLNYLWVPAMRLEGPWLDIVVQISLLLLSMLILAASMSGHFIEALPVPVRAFGTACGIALPLLVDVAGHWRLAAALVLLGFLWLRARRRRASHHISRVSQESS